MHWSNASLCHFILRNKSFQIHNDTKSMALADNAWMYNWRTSKRTLIVSFEDIYLPEYLRDTCICDVCWVFATISTRFFSDCKTYPRSLRVETFGSNAIAQRCQPLRERLRKSTYEYRYFMTWTQPCDSSPFNWRTRHTWLWPVYSVARFYWKTWCAVTIDSSRPPLLLALRLNNKC
jgi:hypothetical protein